LAEEQENRARKKNKRGGKRSEKRETTVKIIQDLISE